MLTGSEPFRVCVGIGYGRMLYSETLEGYFGGEMNLACKLGGEMNLACKLGEDVALGGETLITTAAYENADPALVKSFTQKSLRIAGIDATYFRHQV